MANTFDLSFDVTPTDASAGLGFELWWDDCLLTNIESLTEPTSLRHQLLDDGQAHEVKLVLKNKTDQHTQIDSQGAIVKDACIIVENFCLEDLKLGHLFFEKSVYEHDTNGTTGAVNDNFFGTMGCNGCVKLSVQTPIYLWLLENL